MYCAIDLNQFDIIDVSTFDQYITETKPIDNEIYNHCPDCDVPMNISGSEYQCDLCGLIKQYIDTSKNLEENVNGSIRITTGSNKGRFYNVSNDYSKIQRQIIYNQLLYNQSVYKGNAIPLNILNAVAAQYNNIQKYITEDDIDENGKIRGQKKFVRRGNIKDEILASLIYFEYIKENLVRKKKDIAAFMQLTNSGFSRGEDIIRELHAEGKIDIPDDEPIAGYIERYLDALNIDNTQYLNFVLDLVQESENRKIGMESQVSSKVCGALWILITKLKLPITATQLEKATDNTKKNTFMKFYNIVMKNIKLFMHIFIKYKIPYK